MGDIVSLVERAQEQIDVDEARKLQKKLAKDQFNFNDFIAQIQQIKILIFLLSHHKLS